MSQAWRLVVAGPAARDLEPLPEKAATAVLESFEAIASEPQRVGKRLRFELEGLWAGAQRSLPRDLPARRG